MSRLFCFLFVCLQLFPVDWWCQATLSGPEQVLRTGLALGCTGTASNCAPFSDLCPIHYRFVIYGFYYVVMCCNTFKVVWGVFEVIVMGRCWILQIVWSYDFSFILLMWCNMLIDLHTPNHFCSPQMNPTWSGSMTFSICCWIWFASSLLSMFTSGFTRDISP